MDLSSIRVPNYSNDSIKRRKYLLQFFWLRIQQNLCKLSHKLLDCSTTIYLTSTTDMSFPLFTNIQVKQKLQFGRSCPTFIFQNVGLISQRIWWIRLRINDLAKTLRSNQTELNISTLSYIQKEFGFTLCHSHWVLCSLRNILMTQQEL